MTAASVKTNLTPNPCPLMKRSNPVSPPVYLYVIMTARRPTMNIAKSIAETLCACLIFSRWSSSTAETVLYWCFSSEDCGIDPGLETAPMIATFLVYPSVSADVSNL
jgi:hypothetical protein